LILACQLARSDKAVEHKTLRLSTFTERFEFVIVRFHVLEEARLDAEQIPPQLDSCEIREKVEKETRMVSSLSKRSEARKALNSFASASAAQWSSARFC
jgi:ATP phosphoribosyltransferase